MKYKTDGFCTREGARSNAARFDGRYWATTMEAVEPGFRSKAICVSRSGSGTSGSHRMGAGRYRAATPRVCERTRVKPRNPLGIH
ncbi:hypothetical protein PBR20603_02938 [Pandoraea bronchicola]|uniref:Uncharacterized protein n=1 Tax=Pandoraea bronchicola TaxID=2508287 RepID=A0A5E5BV79_9BURK|nr:hypothetical protein PBR20603_02938 [Pandoraea bronchicola]